MSEVEVNVRSMRSGSKPLISFNPMGGHELRFRRELIRCISVHLVLVHPLLIKRLMTTSCAYHINLNFSLEPNVKKEYICIQRNICVCFVQDLSCILFLLFYNSVDCFHKCEVVV